MMKKLLSILFCTGMGLTTVIAQNTVSETESGEQLSQQFSEDENRFLLKEFSNQAITSLNQSAGGNYAAIIQNGTANIVFLQQVGLRNIVELEQKGDEHIYNSIIQGNDNVSIILQEGAKNTLVQEVKADERIFRITQQGFNNELRQYENGTTPAVPVEIHQRGTGMQVTITNGSAF